MTQIGFFYQPGKPGGSQEAVDPRADAGGPASRCGGNIDPKETTISLLQAPVNQPADAIGEQNIDLLRLDQGGHFPIPKGRMHHGLAASISPGPIIRRALFGSRSFPCPGDPGFISAAGSALRTLHARDFSSLGHRGDHMSTLFAADIAQFVYTISNCVHFIFHIDSKFRAETYRGWCHPGNLISQTFPHRRASSSTFNRSPDESAQVRQPALHRSPDESRAGSTACATTATIIGRRVGNEILRGCRRETREMVSSALCRRRLFRRKRAARRVRSVAASDVRLRSAKALPPASPV